MPITAYDQENNNLEKVLDDVKIRETVETITNFLNLSTIGSSYSIMFNAHYNGMNETSIELSLECEREVSSREIEDYKKILAKQYEDVVLIINGINK